ncbi:MAG: YkgJ family cysteine cluster protein [Acidobacteria bacterium]|nr:YkgJ family cysteine cluster protein [Acidobacteriota bacterium]
MLHACANCPVHLVCCSVSSKGGIVESPYLLPTDIKAISELKALEPEEFVEYRINEITGNTVSFVKTPKGVGCRFHDSLSGKCSIYHARPLDCRLYPLDVMLIQGGYYWILWEHCSITQDDIQALLAYGESILPLIREHLHDYATVPMEMMDKSPFQIIAPIQFPENYAEKAKI